MPFDADVAILGASFAGIEVARRLERDPRGRALRVVVLDRVRRHGYLPLVHERLLGALTLDESELDTAGYVASLTNTKFVEGEIVGLSEDGRTVRLAGGGVLRARAVVVALGSLLECPTELLGREFVYGVKDPVDFARALEKVAELRARSVEAAPGLAPRVLVVGGGLTGVELAAQLRAASSPRGASLLEVTLVERGDRLLPGFSKGAARRTRSILERQGVDVRLQTSLVRVHSEGATLEETTGAAASAPLELPCDLVFWAGGVRANPVPAELPRSSDGFVVVAPTLQAFPLGQGGSEAVFVCGDLARIVGDHGPWKTMVRASECLFQAKVVAHNVLALLSRENRPAAEGPALQGSHRARGAQGTGKPDVRLVPHVLWRHFPYGVSLGSRSLIVYRGLCLDLPGINHWFRRFLMRRYLARYSPRR